VNHIGRVVEGLEIMKRVEEGDWMIIKTV